MFAPVKVATLILLLVVPSAGPTTTLRQAANRTGLLVGTAVRPLLFSEPAYSETLAREFNMIEPEDALKWSVVRREPSGFDFREGDEVVAFAKAHGMRVRGHCLVWDHANPAWLNDRHFSPGELAQILHEHIATEMKHYAGKVFAWDVVNEAYNEDGRLKDSIWHNRPGIGPADKDSAYIEQAFRWAHESDPQALLFYNDNGGEARGQKSDSIYEMVREFKRRGVPIDGVGLQMHISQLEFDDPALAANIARLIALGVQVHITELDVSLPVDSNGAPDQMDLTRQADIYRRVIRTCVQNPGCTAIQSWGFTDKWSWIGSHSQHTRGAALPFDRAYRPKPAYKAFLDELSHAPGRTQPR